MARAWQALLLAPFQPVASLLAGAARILRKRTRPKAVLGMGGFASGPGGLMAWVFYDVPLFLHEQNSIAGLTNRILGQRLATRSYVAFPQAAESNSWAVPNASVTRYAPWFYPPAGTRPRACSATYRCCHLQLLVIGGSLGAAALNRVVPCRQPSPCLERWSNARWSRHQCGEKHYAGL